MSKGKDISTMFTKEENKKNGRLGYCQAAREKDTIISPSQYGAFLQKRGKRSGDYIFKKYQVKEIDRKLSRRLDISLLLEFDSVRLWFLESKKGGKK